MRRTLAILVVAPLVLFACGGDDDDSAGSAPVSLSGTVNNHGNANAADGLKMEADDFYFGPTFVKATAGQRFTIELENEGAAPHTFTIPRLSIDEELAPGAKKTVTVTAPQTGTLAFTCRFHIGQGMQGAIYVA